MSIKDITKWLEKDKKLNSLKKLKRYERNTLDDMGTMRSGSEYSYGKKKLKAIKLLKRKYKK